MNEIWRDVVGYKELYQISNRGKVRSLDRVIVVTTRYCSFNRRVKGRILRLGLGTNGYSYCILYRDDKKTLWIHRLVAQAFLPNPDNKPEVNHKNGIKADCSSSNLEWATHMENHIHARNTGLYNDKGENNSRAVAVIQVDKVGKIIKKFGSIGEAARELKIKCSNISAVCKKKYGFKTAGGFRWEYA